MTMPKDDAIGKNACWHGPSGERQWPCQMASILGLDQHVMHGHAKDARHGHAYKNTVFQPWYNGHVAHGMVPGHKPRRNTC